GRSNGSRVGPISHGRRRLRCPAICRRRGGMNHSHDEGVAVSSGDGIDGRQHTGSAPEGIDDLFRRAVARSPDVLALVDPPDREAFTDAAPWRLTYAQADRVIDVLAGRLLDLGLPAGSTVAFQMPNTVESVIVLLGVLRA